MVVHHLILPRALSPRSKHYGKQFLVRFGEFVLAAWAYCTKYEILNMTAFGSKFVLLDEPKSLLTKFQKRPLTVRLKSLGPEIDWNRNSKKVQLCKSSFAKRLVPAAEEKKKIFSPISSVTRLFDYLLNIWQFTTMLCPTAKKWPK